MRGLLLAVAILTAPMAGCAGLTGEPLSIQQADLPLGLLLTYRIENEGSTSTETFVVVPQRDGGYTLNAYNLSRPGFGSPYLELSSQLNPTRFNWSQPLQWPLEPGKRYEATVGGAEATVKLEAVEGVEGPTGAEKAIRAVATADGETVAELTVLQDPPILKEIKLDTPDGTEEHWTLEEARYDQRFNRPPAWSIGQWWSYNATTKTEHAETTLIYNANATNNKGVPQRVLNAQRVESRLAALPFHTLRARDLAPQSGFLTSLLGSFWSWPLVDGKQWTGSTSLARGGYTATVQMEDRVPLPDGTVTTAYTIEAVPTRQPGAEPIGTYQYAPRVGFLTSIQVNDPGSQDEIIDWELTDWGDGFHGEIEIPHRVQLWGRNRTTGPAEIEESFPVPERMDRLQLRGMAVRRAGSNPNASFALVDPSGEQRFLRDAGDWQDRRINLRHVTDAVNGTWTFRADLPEGVTFFVIVRGIWVETKTVDYR